MATLNTFTASDGKPVAYYSWIPRNEIKGVVQIVHGMAEHAARYDHFAVKLRTKGFAVYASDHRGHGKTLAEADQPGYFAPEGGWQRVVSDLYELTEIIRLENPGKRLFLIGHSMGSFLSRSLISTHGQAYDGVILSGTAASPGLIGHIGRILARLAVSKDGGKKPNKRLNDMSFGSYNKPFAPNRTEFDWLSRDEKQVDAYVEDPLCGFVCTSGFFYDLLGGLLSLGEKSHYESIPKQLPMLIVSGEADPVGDMGKGVRRVAELYRKAGLTDLSCTLYPEARHEIFNETNRNEVENDCIAWINERL